MCCAWLLSHVRLFATPWTVPTRLLCPWGFSRQNYWSELPCSLLGDLPYPGIKPRSPTLQTDSLPFEPPGKPRILEWAAYPFSRGFSRPNDQTWSPALQTDGFFTTEPPEKPRVIITDSQRKRVDNVLPEACKSLT